MKLSVVAASVVIAAVGIVTEVAHASFGRQQAVNETARQLADFRERVDQYVSVRKKAAKESPPLKETNNPAQIKAAQEGLAARVRTLRAEARPGDIFTADVRPIFRQLLAPRMRGAEGRDTKAILAEGAPPSVPLKINARYPETAPLPTVPPNVLKALPPLPKEVEYRLVKKDLLLFDPEAEIIVDYIANAIR